MTTDAGPPEPPEPSPNLWRLPDAISVRAVRVRYEEPRTYAVGARLAQAHEAVEILLETSEPFPDRALSPALYVDDVELTESQQVGHSLYRFYAYDFEDLKESGVVSIGWMGQPQLRKRTELRYEISGTERKPR
jgi:hypothetical protein